MQSAADQNFDSYLMANPATMEFGVGLQALSQGVQFIKQLTAQLENIFGIGRGRNEADLISSYQNQLVSDGGRGDFSGIVNQADIISKYPEHQNVSDMNQIFQITNQAVNAFYKYIGYPDYPKTNWPDGRASRQAYASVSPYSTDVVRDLKNRLIGLGGTITPIASLNLPGGNIGAQLTNKLAQLESVDSGSVFTQAGVGVMSTNTLLVVGGVVLLGAIAFSMGGRRNG